jgi:hypothetical protein
MALQCALGSGLAGDLWEPGEDGGTVTEFSNIKAVEITMPLVKFVQFDEQVVINHGERGLRHRDLR